MELEQMGDEEILNEAMKQGFNPEYNGENKKSPKEYLEVSFNHNKMLKERNDKLSATVESLNQKMERLVAFQTEQKQKAVDSAVEKLKAERKDAIIDGDHEKVDQIDQKIQAEQQTNVANSENNPILDAWLGRNHWYNDDETLAIEADIVAKQLHETGRFTASHKDYEKLLSLVEQKIKSAFPDKFKNPKKDNPPEVDSGHPSSPHSQLNKTYADLPPDAKRACDAFVKDKIMTKEQYLEIYEWDD
jgi:exonuclease VII large subunit